MTKQSDNFPLVLSGGKQISNFLGIDPSSLKHLVATTNIPVFRLGLRKLGAQPTSLTAWLQDRENKGTTA